MERDTFIKGRIAFGPEALSRFTQIIEEVALELVGEAFLPHRCTQPKCAPGWHEVIRLSAFVVDGYSN